MFMLLFSGTGGSFPCEILSSIISDDMCRPFDTIPECFRHVFSSHIVLFIGFLEKIKVAINVQ